MDHKGKLRASKPRIIVLLLLVAHIHTAAARSTSLQNASSPHAAHLAPSQLAKAGVDHHQQQHGRSLKQFSAPGQLMAGMASEGAMRGVNKLMAATLLGNFYGSEGFGFRNYAGALPAPGGIELLALKALGAATGIGGMAAAGAATALGGPLASASTGGGHMMGLESLLPGVEVLGALKGGAKGVTKKLLKGASALLGDDTTSSSSSGLTTTTVMTDPGSNLAGSGPAAKMGALIDSIERKHTKVRGGAVKTIGGVLTKVGQAWQAAGNKMQGGAVTPTTVVYNDMQGGTGTTYSSSSGSSMMMPSSGGSYIMPGSSTSTMGGMSNLGSSGGFSSGGQGVTFGGGSSGGATGMGFGSSGGGMADAGAGSGGLSGGNFGITAGPGGININAGIGATGTTGAGAGAAGAAGGGIPMQGGLAQPQMQAPGFSSQAMDSAGQMAGGEMQGFAPAAAISSSAPAVNPTNPNVVPGVRLESGNLSTPQQQAAVAQQQQAAALQQQQAAALQQQQWLQQWQMPLGSQGGQVNAQRQQQQSLQQQAPQQQQLEQAQQLQAQQQLQMQQQQYQQLQAQQLQQELQQQQLQQQQLLQQQQQQQAALQQQQDQQQQSWPLSGLNLESGTLQQQQQGDVPVSGPYKSTDELVANALQQAAILSAGGDWNLRKANPKAAKAWGRSRQQDGATVLVEHWPWPSRQ